MQKIKMFVTMILMMVLTGCAKGPEAACDTVTRMGFTGCTVTEDQWTPPWVVGTPVGCHAEDRVAYTVSATNSGNAQVSLTVCCGSGSCTIRNVTDLHR